MYRYVKIDEDGFAVGQSMLSGKVSYPDMISIPIDKEIKMGQKYDRECGVFTNTFRPKEVEQSNGLTDVQLLAQQVSSLELLIIGGKKL